ncbi:DUF5667 domain-containing protein [Patescibacteria group bacterium]|nr:DUF5667 domain-containing protein [Patescibacteria group bacterium]
MKILLRQIKILLTIFLSLFAFSLVFSRNAAPDSPFLFKVRRLQEKTLMFLKFSPESKAKYYEFLLERRLKDLSTVIRDGEPSFILSSSLRYSTTAGQLTELIQKNKMKSEVASVSSIFKEHQKSLSELINSYPKDRDGEWKYIQDDINYLDTYSRYLFEL